MQNYKKNHYDVSFSLEKAQKKIFLDIIFVHKPPKGAQVLCSSLANPYQIPFFAHSKERTYNIIL